MLSSLKEEFSGQSWIPILTAGLVSGVNVVLTGIIPMAALVFAGNLERFLATGISIALMSSVILAIVLAFRSSYVGIVAFLVAEEATILGGMATAIAQSMPANATDTDLLLTIVAAIALSSLVTGAFLFALGHFNLGELIRFLPYPVVGGFLAGLGYLITDASFRVLTNGTLGLINLPQLLQPEWLLRWVPSLALALLLLVVTRRPTSHYLALPGLVLGAVGLFYLVLFLTQTSTAQALQQGWLLGPFPEGSRWNPLNVSQLAQAHWGVILSQLVTMAVLMTITALSLLLVCSALELITERDINLNQELRATGLGCFLSGLVGGMVGSPAVSTVLTQKMGVRSRLIGVVSALFYLVILLGGISFLTFFPKPVLGGLLMYLGLELLALQLYDGWFRLPKLDYAIVVFVMAIVVIFGFLVGVGVGLVVLIVLFALNYSQIDVARYSLSGASLRSHYKRPPNQERLLQSKGDQTHVVTLQGYIFFGTAHRLLNQIRQRLHQTALAPLKFVILDFHWVTGLDSSAIASFVKLKQLANREGFQVVLTGLSETLVKPLHQSQVLGSDEGPCREFPDLDRGLEWCENQILGSSQYRRARQLPLSLQLKTSLTADNQTIKILMDHLQPLQLEENQFLFVQGGPADTLFFVESGEISTFMTIGQGQPQRIQTLGAGTMLGEVEFYARLPYEVSAVANQPSRLYGLHINGLQTLRQDHPEVAALLTETMIQSLANRLTVAQQEIALLTAR